MRLQPFAGKPAASPGLFRALIAAIAMFAFMAAPSFAQKRTESLQGPSVASRTPDYDAPASEFAGPEACKDCHKNEFIQYEKTGHAKLSFPGKDYIHGCETCHGPGKAHSDSVQAAHGDDADIAKAMAAHPIFAFKGKAEENASRCLSCHVSSKQQSLFDHSEHAGHGISCNQCHSAHLVDEVKDAAKGDMTHPQGYFFQLPQIADENRWRHNSMLKRAEPALCYDCHQTIQAQFAQPEHHRVPEGLMKCSDCHNPHGSENVAALNKSVSETCVNCHVEKRGPFVFEHPAVKVEGCVTCHNPHGSSNRMLLVRREGRQLCLQCHTGFHGQLGAPHGKLGFQTSGECIRCHVTVHGSSLDPNFLR